MTSDEFNRLLNALTRLSIALRAVVDATGEAGAEALRRHCGARQEQDERHATEASPEQSPPRLWFDGERWNIGDRELHCGDCFQVFIGETWHDVRIEHSASSGWYLVGLPKHYSTRPRAYPARRDA